MLNRIVRGVAIPLLLIVLLAPLGSTPTPFAAQAAPAPQQTPPTTLPVFPEAEPNNTPEQADAQPAIGSAAERNWLQPISGGVAGAGDIDYYRFNVAAPGSQVRVRLSGLNADYDLVLAAAEQPEGTLRGLEGITEVGGQISAIGGQISAIGGQISAIGGQISAIGGQISAIGGQISAISANAGNADETIDTILWMPGAYYVAVAPANGQSTGTPYRLEVELRGSALSAAPPAPNVAIRETLPSTVEGDPSLITTLYIHNSQRMLDRFPFQETEAVSISDSLESLIFNPPFLRDTPEYGMALDIGNLLPASGEPPANTIAAAYALWDANPGNPFYANYIARIIDNVIEAVTVADATPGVSGPAPKFVLGPPTNSPLFLPNVQYIVLVGNDEVLPFFRIPDLTTIANEADYAAYLRELDPSGIIDVGSPLGAALANRMLLTDNPYGAERPYTFLSSPIHLPRMAVGRLVETPADIAAYLERYEFENSITEGNGYEMNYEGYRNGSASAFVSGYDFLIDQAVTISDTLERAGFGPQEVSPTFTETPGLVTPLINNNWTATNLEGRWFEGLLSSTFPESGFVTPSLTYADFSGQLLGSVNAHFDHWQVIPAQDTNGTFAALRLLAPTYDPFGGPGGYFVGTLNYSVGCHSGYNVPESALSLTPQSPRYTTYAADFAQSFNRHAGNWIGNTGYGYGTLDGVDYSEQLAVLLTEELLRDVRGDDDVYIGQAIGTALMNAKQRYLRNLAVITAYDAKSMAVMTLYGLPFIPLRAFPEYALPAPPEIGGDSGNPPPAERPVPQPIPVENGRLERIITVTIDFEDAELTLPRTGSTVFNLTEDDFSIEDSFVEAGFGDDDDDQSLLRLLTNNQVGVPVLPRFAYDISALNSDGTTRLVPRDVQFIGGVYGQIEAFKPQMTQLVTETRELLSETDLQPTFEAGAGIWYPARFFGLSSVETENGIRDQLTAAAAQFRADATGETGAIRPYEQMVFRVLYIDPEAEGAAELLADTEPPVIERVIVEPLGGLQIAQSSGASTRVAVIAGDARGSGLSEVAAVYIQNNTEWIPVTFSRPDPQNAPRLWVTEIPVAVGDVRLIVRATDAAGNTSYYTAKGSFNPPEQPRIFLPTIRR